MLAPRALALCALPLVVACASGPGLRLTLIDASVQRPSNIAVYFTIEKPDGLPVAGLAADQFRIYEDGEPVSVLESKQTILNPEVAAAHYTLLLIDMSGSVTESGDVPVIVDATKAFAERVQKVQKVSVYAFDGSPGITRIGGVEGVDRLADYHPRDPSTNLNGAIVEALKVLHGQMRSSPVPLTFGTLVIFTDGTDRAHRVPREKLHEQLVLANVDVLVIGVGAEISESELQIIGRDGAILSKDRAQIAASFDTAAARVEAYSRRYYLLGYCSPARAGAHDVRITANHDGRSGSLSYRFDAAGFGPDCDPTRKPSFNIRRPRGPAQPQPQIEIEEPARSRF